MINDEIRTLIIAAIVQDKYELFIFCLTTLLAAHDVIHTDNYHGIN